MTLLAEKKVKALAKETMDLIPEARLRKRRRRLRTGVILVIVSAVVTFASIDVGGLRSHTLPRSGAGAGSRKGSVSPLLEGTVINASSVTAIQMLSPTRGVAVSTFWSKRFSKVEHSYLTTTNDGGVSWRVGGLLPAGTSSPNFSWSPMIAFFTAHVGYVATSFPRTFYLTTNGGRTWSNVAVSGTPTALWASNGQLLVVTERCSNYSTTPFCGATYLSSVHPGSIAAWSALRIPSVLPKTNSRGPTISAYPATVIAWHQSIGVAVENYLSSQHGAHLLATANSGTTWRPLINPCPQGGQPFAQAVSELHWYLMCSAGVGMGKAENWLYATTNAGLTWTLLAQGSLLASSPNIGGIGVMSVNSFGASTDGKYLWINGGPGFLQVSADGGRHWKFVGPGRFGNTSNTIGLSFTSIGHEAWMPILRGGLVRTTDGVSWQVLGVDAHS